MRVGESLSTLCVDTLRDIMVAQGAIKEDDLSALIYFLVSLPGGL